MFWFLPLLLFEGKLKKKRFISRGIAVAAAALPQRQDSEDFS